MQTTCAGLRARNAIVEQVVDLLVAEQYDELLHMAPRSRITAKEVRAAIIEHGRHLVAIPRSAHELICHVAVRDTCPARWSVVVPLFTKEEGRSDLSLELSMVMLPSGACEVQVDDIHVL